MNERDIKSISDRLIRVEAKQDVLVQLMESRLNGLEEKTKSLEGRLWGLVILGLTSLGGAGISLVLAMATK